MKLNVIFSEKKVESLRRNFEKELINYKVNRDGKVSRVDRR